jgi:hypothetical protein
MIYELRTYAIAAGQMAEELRRMAMLAFGGEPDAAGRVPGYDTSLMRECGVPPMLGVWSSMVGGGADRFYYLCRYRDIDQRDESWTRFWDHPGLARAIAATTRQATQVVEWTFPILMRPNAAWTAIRGAGHTRAIGRVHELRIDRVAFGETARAHEILAKADFPLLSARGAAVLGSFDVWMGPGIPSIVTFLAWPDPEARERAWRDLDRDANAVALRRRHRQESGGTVFERGEAQLLDPAPYCVPAADFGEEA